MPETRLRACGRGEEECCVTRKEYIAQRSDVQEFPDVIGKRSESSVGRWMENSVSPRMPFEV